MPPRRSITIAVIVVGLALLASAVATPAFAQFGRNKVQYRTFDFQVLHTKNFDIYYYPEEVEAANIVARLAERWRERLGRFFEHELRGRQAVVLYASGAHFRQTNAIEGLLGEGTGGVTEALRRRIVLPMGGSLADTDHVLGHELVHAYQFDITGTEERMTDGSAPAALAFPLWFIEGMAEYVSLGPVDSQTAMWIRDGVLQEKLPRVQDLEKPEYFPYRWGQAFWAYVGAKWGDRWVASLLRSAANPRSDLRGFAAQLGTTPDELNKGWHDAMRDATRVVTDDQPPVSSDAKRVIAESTGGGRLNVGAKLSADGRSLAFYSEKDLFSIDLFLADAANGRIERKLISTANDPHFDTLQFLNSAGGWSPNGRTLALGAERAGKPVLVLIDAPLGRITREIALPGLDDAWSPAWSPDGARIVMSGNRDGLVDLYLLTLATGALKQLTIDAYAEFEPVFTPDGGHLIFSTDRFTTDLTGLVPGPLRLAEMDLASQHVTPIAGFLRGRHLSPQVSPDGTTLTFVAEPDGVPNVYRMAITGGPIVQLTSFATGVSGVTATSPALSMASQTGRLAFSVFEKSGASVYVLDPADEVEMVPPRESSRGAVLPPRQEPCGPLFQALTDYARGLPPLLPQPPTAKYTPSLQVDSIGQPSVTAGVSSWGAYVGGSVSAAFSDMLGDRVLSTGAQVSGTLDDLGGWLTFINRKHRWNWGLSVEQAPFRAEQFGIIEDDAAQTISEVRVIDRQISRGVLGLTAFPLNEAERLEVSGGVRHLNFNREIQTVTYDLDSTQFLSRTSEKTPTEHPLNLAEGRVAFVHDTAFFGAISPIFGRRYRLEIGRSQGTLSYNDFLLDGRQYFMPVRPVTLAIRGMSYGRFGRDAQDPLLIPLFLGYPDIVHGYGFESLDASECPGLGRGQTTQQAQSSCAPFDKLTGSRLAAVNVEVRAPLPGLFRGQIDYGRLPIEIVGFFDAGATWSAGQRPTFAGGDRGVSRAAGAAVRVNLFGLIPIELSVARPFDRPDRSLRWQIGIRQGF